MKLELIQKVPETVQFPALKKLYEFCKKMESQFTNDSVIEGEVHVTVTTDALVKYFEEKFPSFKIINTTGVIGIEFENERVENMLIKLYDRKQDGILDTDEVSVVSKLPFPDSTAYTAGFGSIGRWNSAGTVPTGNTFSFNEFKYFTNCSIHHPTNAFLNPFRSTRLTDIIVPCYEELIPARSFQNCYDLHNVKFMEGFKGPEGQTFGYDGWSDHKVNVVDFPSTWEKFSTDGDFWRVKILCMILRCEFPPNQYPEDSNYVGSNFGYGSSLDIIYVPDEYYDNYVMKQDNTRHAYYIGGSGWVPVLPFSEYDPSKYDGYQLD